MRPIGVFIVVVMLAPPLAGQDMPLTQVIAPGEGWRPIIFEFQSISAISGDGRGSVFIADPDARQIVRAGPDGMAGPFAKTSAPVRGLAVRPDGTVLATQPERRRIVQFDARGTEKVFAEKLGAVDLVVAKSGSLYCTLPEDGAIAVVAADGSSRKVAADIGRPTGLVLWSDHATLVVGDHAGNSLRVFRIEANGALTHGERYYRPYAEKGKVLEPAGLVIDGASRLYAATRSGVQIFDPIGRLCGVLARPTRATAHGVAFGGQKLDRLYAAFGNQLYARSVLSKGLTPASGN